MGLFGDKKIKKLTHELESGWLALGLGVEMGRGAETAHRIAAAVLAAASTLAADGRAADAQSRITAASKSGDGVIEGLWNALLADVARQL